MTVDRAAEVIQFTYPQVYYACHTRHARARSGPERLSPRDAQVLVHLDRSAPMTLSTLADHLGLSLSTLSEAITALAGLGYVEKTRERDRDRRRVGLVLTPRGLAAVRRSSVLETARLQTVLRRLSAADRGQVAAALSMLAEACRPVRHVRQGRGTS